MKNVKLFRIPMMALALVTMLAVSCTDDQVNAPAPVPNIAQIVEQNPDFSLLRAAVAKAGLGNTLANTQNITVFAPDNVAFANSGITNIDGLSATQLQGILSYHVVGQRVPASAVPVSDTVRTLNSRNIYASRNGNGTFVNGIRVRRPDLGASNGIIHVIDRVLTPPSRTILAIALEDTSFSFLATAVNRLGLVPTLGGPGKFTVFAPTNAAFRAVGINDVNAVPLATLEAVVRLHVAPTNVFTSDMVSGQPINTIGAAPVFPTLAPFIQVRAGGSTQPLSAVTASNIVALNGVVHVINRVILP